jgi:hypothetical protein
LGGSQKCWLEIQELKLGHGQTIIYMNIILGNVDETTIYLEVSSMTW